MTEQPHHRQLLARSLRHMNALPMRFGVVPDDARAAAFEILIECAHDDAHLLQMAALLADAELFPTPFEIRNVARQCAPPAPVAQYEPPEPATPEQAAEIAAIVAQVHAAASKGRAVPEAKGATLPNDTSELYLPEGREALLNQARVNSERLNRAEAAAAKAAQVAELERKYGKIQ